MLMFRMQWDKLRSDFKGSECKKKELAEEVKYKRMKNKNRS